MDNDIVGRLRRAAQPKNIPRRIKIFDNAADEIERLRQQVADLVNALQTISEWKPSSATQPRQKIIDNMQLYARLSANKATGDA